MQQNISHKTPIINKENIEKTKDKEVFVSTRHKSFPIEPYDPSIPRLGRRESEPHSKEIMYLYDVLTTNFLNDRTMWDLHHYFQKDDLRIDVQFDVSFYRDFNLPYELPSYKASEHENRVPTLAVNVLSKSTWKEDLSIHLDYCRILKIPLYATFSTYEISPKPYKPPFLRIYELQSDGNYKIKEINELTFNEKGEFNPKAIIDLGDVVPFRFGLDKRKTKFKGGAPLYRLILFKMEKNEILLTKAEVSEKKAEASEKKAKASERKAKASKKKAKASEKKAKASERKAEKALKKYEREKEKLSHLEKEINELKNELHKKSG